MQTIVTLSNKPKASANLLVIVSKSLTGLDAFLSKSELDFVAKNKSDKTQSFSINQYNRWVFVEIESDKVDNSKLEASRKRGSKLFNEVKAKEVSEIEVVSIIKSKETVFALLEGLLLSNYDFSKYLTEKPSYQLKEIKVSKPALTENDITSLQVVVEGVNIARDLVNEPVSYLDAVQYAKDIKKYGKDAGFSVETLNKKQIEALKMGGVLAVNKGSVTPPTFNILEWKPKNATNKKPVVFVGKGIVYDTGGLSIKPTAGSMDLMKSDMGGSAIVVGVLYAIAKLNLPIHVIGLIPATDNRPSLDAYAPGDIITMFDGTTVEVLNTDAEGRLVLADALTYAKKYNPELVIDLATLTGAAVRAIGTKGIVSMGIADKDHSLLEEVGYRTHERIAKMPFWDDYAEEMKSPIADLNNLGGPYAGQITAGKFLEHFVLDKKTKKHAYPWLHLDVAGPSFLPAKENYLPKGGTGVGVRLLVEFLKTKYNV